MAVQQNIIAVIFDFDDTLAPDSTSSYLDSIGVDTHAFWGQRVAPLLSAGWDPVPAYLHEMIRESMARPPGERITRDSLAGWGAQVQLYNGATRIFSMLEKQLAEAGSAVQLEFYLISSGIGDLLRATRVASRFRDMWACEFHYGEDGGIVYPRNIVSFTDKTRYVFQIAKGLVGPDARGRPFDVNRKIPASELRIPMDQMIFVGDGYTDIPCFSLIQKQGGIALGVYDPEDRARWGRAWGFIAEGRLSNLCSADYGKRSDLARFLTMAVTHIAERIELRASTYQG